MKTKMASFLGVFAALALVFAPHMAKADLIYWMLDKPTYSAGKQTGDYVDFAFATISADGRTLDIYNSTTGGSDGQLLVPDGSSSTGYSSTPVYAGTFDSDSVSSFLVELWNSDGERMGWQTYSIDDLLKDRNIWSGDKAYAGDNPLSVGSVIPEPSSGLMLLLGGMLLALRRRKA